MAYPFSYYGQQPFQYQDQLNQLRNAPGAMPVYQPPRQDTALNWVQGEAGAKSWIVTPGSTVLLMDSEAQRFYLKSADANGVPAMRIFEYTEIVPARAAQPVQAAQFVTIDEFNAFKAEVVNKLGKPANEKGETNE